MFAGSLIQSKKSKKIQVYFFIYIVLFNSYLPLKNLNERALLIKKQRIINTDIIFDVLIPRNEDIISLHILYQEDLQGIKT